MPDSVGLNPGSPFIDDMILTMIYSLPASVSPPIALDRAPKTEMQEAFSKCQLSQFYYFFPIIIIGL